MPRVGLRPGVRLVALSFLMLFVELALIRWTGSNVLHLSYFSSFVLLGSFLGIGIGFLRADRERDLFPYALSAVPLRTGPGMTDQRRRTSSLQTGASRGRLTSRPGRSATRRWSSGAL